MRNITTSIILVFSLFVSSQNFKPKTISLPENLSIKDLSFLKDELKDVQVVMLGELDHHDGNVFEMKTKVVKYLYQEMGFKTIAFESGVFDVWKAQQAIKSGEDTKRAIIKSLFSIWSKRNEFQSFIEFYDKNKKDLKLYGFDNQITGTYGQMDLINDLYSYCNEYNFEFKLKQDDLSLLVESMNLSWVFDDDEISYKQYKKELTNLLEKIEQKPKLESHFYWTQIIKNLLSLAEELNANEEENFGSFWASANYNYRDRQMADNLLAYIKKYPEEKIICWGCQCSFCKRHVFC